MATGIAEDPKASRVLELCSSIINFASVYNLGLNSQLILIILSLKVDQNSETIYQQLVITVSQAYKGN